MRFGYRFKLLCRSAPAILFDNLPHPRLPAFLSLTTDGHHLHRTCHCFRQRQQEGSVVAVHGVAGGRRLDQGCRSARDGANGPALWVLGLHSVPGMWYVACNLNVPPCKRATVPPCQRATVPPCDSKGWVRARLPRLPLGVFAFYLLTAAYVLRAACCVLRAACCVARRCQTCLLSCLRKS